MLVPLLASQTSRPPVSLLRYVYGGVDDHNSIVGRAAIGGYADLRRARLAQGDAEVRVWEGFGVTYLQGVVLQRRAGVWTAVRLLSAVPGTSKKGWAKTFPSPKGGWPSFWKKADALGIWTLPDDATLPQKGAKQVLDGFSYAVETVHDGRYRAYAYDNPEYQTQWPEAKAMIAIGKLLDAAFPHPVASSTSRSGRGSSPKVQRDVS